MVLGSGWDHMDEVTPAHAARLSERGESVFLTQSDGAMVAEITGFVGGHERWSVIGFRHDEVPDVEDPEPYRVLEPG